MVLLKSAYPFNVVHDLNLELRPSTSMYSIFASLSHIHCSIAQSFYVLLLLFEDVADCNSHQSKAGRQFSYVFYLPGLVRMIQIIIFRHAIRHFC